jgi:hypothetical protein
LLCAALGLALAYAPRRDWLPGLVVLGITSVVVSFAPIPLAWTDSIFLGCWASIILNAALVHVHWRFNALIANGLALNAGWWAGALVRLSSTKHMLFLALACSLVVLPAARIVLAGRGVIVKILSSWLIAISLLAAALQFLPVTPGYLPDHME